MGSGIYDLSEVFKILVDRGYEFLIGFQRCNIEEDARENLNFSLKNYREISDFVSASIST